MEAAHTYTQQKDIFIIEEKPREDGFKPGFGLESKQTITKLTQRERERKRERDEHLSLLLL